MNRFTVIFLVFMISGVKPTCFQTQKPMLNKLQQGISGEALQLLDQSVKLKQPYN